MSVCEKSNKLSNLADKLFESMFDEKKDFFKTKEVLVPSKKMESFLKSYYLKNNDGILMNIKVDTLSNGLLSLFNNDKSIASINEMTLAIINYLSNNKVEELDHYLSGSNNALQGIKIYDTSYNLAKLFNDLEKDLLIYTLNGYKLDIYNAMLETLNDNNLDTLYNIYKTKSFAIKKDFSIFGVCKYSKLEESIIEEYKKENNIDEYLLQLDMDSYDEKSIIIKSPSKLREIECIHSIICDLLMNKGAKYSDILVVGNNISSYETTISRVFNQDNIKFPNIPYYINAKAMKDNEVLNGLKRIKDIVDKGYFTRLDFISLAQNKIIQSIRNISDEDVKTFSDTIIAINAYRGIGENTDSFRADDWVYARNRLLLSKISDSSGEDNLDKLSIDGKYYIPYSRIGLDDNGIVTFISLIDDIVNIINVYKSIDKIDKDNIKVFKEALDRFFSIKEDDDIELNIYYKNVSQILDMIIYNGFENISINTILYLLISCAEISSRNKGELYGSGISFTNYDINTVLSAKYIFFINCGSKELPIKKINNPFLDKKELINYDDEETIFNLYYQNAERTFISYVYLDLKTGEDFYLSNFVKNLLEKQNYKIDEEKYEPISIDEKREWVELFTNKEFKNKQFRIDLLNKKKDETKDKKVVDYENIVDDTVTTNQMAAYLDEPLSYKASRLFSRSDETNKNLKKEFEPFSTDGLTGYKLFKKIIDELNNKPNIDIFTVLNLDKDNTKEITDEQYEEYIYTSLELLNSILLDYDLDSLKDVDIPKKYKELAYKMANIDFEENVATKLWLGEDQNRNLYYSISMKDFVNYLKESNDSTSSLEEYEFILDNKFLLFNFKDMLDKVVLDYIKMGFTLRKSIPDLYENLNNQSFAEVYNNYLYLLDHIKDYMKESKEKEGINYIQEYLHLDSISINLSSDSKFKLVNNNYFFRLKDDNKLVYFASKNLEKIRNKDFLELYIISLMDIISNGDSNEYEVKLNTGVYRNNLCMLEFKTNKEEAIAILKDIYLYMTDYSDNMLLPYDFLVLSEPESFYDLLAYMYDDNCQIWKNFEDKKLFDYEEELGYSEADYEDKMYDMMGKQRKLILFLNKKDDGGADSNDDVQN